MHVLVTGAAGFLGSRIVRKLLAGVAGLPAASRVVAADVTPCAIDDRRVERRVGTVTDPAFAASAAAGADLVFHLAAVLSGQAEADFDLGMQVNADGTRSLLEACRRSGKAPRVVFTSSLAVFGGAMPEVVPDDMVLMPQSSYGTAKAIGELLVCDYSRRGFVDGVACRLPTICVRPGKPNSATSSFVSGIIREPLAGLESTCPVPLSTRLWISSPDVVLANLLHAASLPAAAFARRRVIDLPGLTVTPREMLESLERLGGAKARALVRCEEEKRIADIVCSWPGAVDVRRPLAIGFAADQDFDAIVRQYIERARAPTG